VVHRKVAAEQIGGWRDYRTIPVDPETDLWQRIQQAGFVIQDVARLTAVKFPASRRKDVYKKRSSHEQQQWTERILREPDLEAVEMGRLLMAANVEVPPTTFSLVFRALLGGAHPGSIRWRSLFSIRSLLSAGRLQPPERGGSIAWIRKFKGAE
jgi:hypothetical protein